MEENINKENHTLEITGGKELFEDDFHIIEKFARRSIEKISRLSPYNHLKITFKSIGNTTGTHMRKIEVKLLLSHGNKVITLENQISTGTSDELTNDKHKENWNVPQLVQRLLKSLEEKVKSEHKKH